MADLRLHSFEDRLNLSHFHILNGAFEVGFVFTEVHFCPHARFHMSIPQSGCQGTCEAITRPISDCSEERVSATCPSLRRAVCGSMDHPTPHAATDVQHESVFSRGLLFLHMILCVNSVRILPGFAESESLMTNVMSNGCKRTSQALSTGLWR